jgi:hypothetical protein
MSPTIEPTLRVPAAGAHSGGTGARSFVSTEGLRRYTEYLKTGRAVPIFDLGNCCRAPDAPA